MNMSLETHVTLSDGSSLVYPPGVFGYALKDGLIPSDALYWQAGMSDWRPVAEARMQEANLPPLISRVSEEPHPQQRSHSATEHGLGNKQSFYSEFIPFKRNVTEESGVWLGVGRIGRRQFLSRTVSLVILYVMIVFVMSFTLALIDPRLAHKNANSISMYVGLAFGALFIIQTAKRLQDTNSSGWFSLLMLIPFIQLLFFLLLLCYPGQKTFNRYGAAFRIS